MHMMYRSWCTDNMSECNAVDEWNMYSTDNAIVQCFRRLKRPTSGALSVPSHIPDKII